MRMKIAVACLLTLVATLIVVAPASACKLQTKPSTVDCYFSAVVLEDLNNGKIWWTGGDTILHVRGLTKLVGLFYGPIWIGNATITTDYCFNTRSGKGIFIRSWEMTFFQPLNWPSKTPASIPNPYGIGTLEGIEVGKATSILFQIVGTSVELASSPCDYTGKLVATHGTGDFKKATLSADTLGFPYTVIRPPPNPPVTLVRINVGGTLDEPTGKLTFHG
jgi:hypothetical protein